MIVHVRLKPGARKDEIVGMVDGYLHVNVREQAKEQRANRALVEVLAEYLGVARGCIKLKKGLKSRYKTVEIECIDEKTVNKLLKGERGKDAHI